MPSPLSSPRDVGPAYKTLAILLSATVILYTTWPDRRQNRSPVRSTPPQATVAKLSTVPLLTSPRRLGSLQQARQCACEDCDVLKNLSYPLPAYWPLPPLPMVMESIPRTCDLCWAALHEHPNPCERFSSREYWNPDPHVREVLVSLLAPCALSPGDCSFMDLGANMGVFSLWAWALGAQVLYVEPQLDLVTAFQRTLRLNCVQAEDVEVLHAGVTASLDEANASLPFDSAGSWRQCHPEDMPGAPRYTDSSAPVPLLHIHDLLLKRPTWDLLKLDIDGQDVNILSSLLDLVEARRVRVRSLVIEWNAGRGRGDLIQRLHAANYTLYRLNVHDGRRHFDERGWDVISGYGDIQTQAYYSEVFMQRAIRFALKVVKGLTVEQYDRLIFDDDGIPEFLVTTEELEEPSHENLSKRGRRPHGFSTPP